MAEEKEKKKTTSNSPKRNQNRNSKRGQSTNKNTNRKNYKRPNTKTSSKKKTNPNKVANKPKVKEEPKKEVQTPKVEVPKEIPKDEDYLEKTLIFDGSQNKNLNDVIEKIEEDNVVFEDKIVKRSKVKKVIVIILLLAMAAVIIATAVYVSKNNPKKTLKEPETIVLKDTLNSNIYSNVSQIVKQEGTLTTSGLDNKVEDIDYSNIETIPLKELEEKIINKEDIVVLIASANCYHCITFEPTINDVFKENKKTIYRLNVTALTKEEVERFRSYYGFTVTPTIFSVKNGYVNAEVSGTMSKEELTTWVTEKI